jgi:Fe-S cluster assembly ATP-binding protein
MLLIEELKVEVGGKEILKNVNMEIRSGETHILFGPNGSGKTSLMMTIMGFSGYKVTHGKITFKGEDITYKPLNERARMGVGVLIQRPPTIRGLKTRTMVNICARNRDLNVDELAEQLRCTEFLDRDINHHFSGGEIKRSELMQLTAQQPDLVLLDEPESGVDLENIALVGDAINTLLNRGTKFPKGKRHRDMGQNGQKSALVITHTGHILDYITTDKGQVLYDGVMCCSKNAGEILKWIREYGYQECIRCSN